MELGPGTVIQDKYRITKLIGQGGMGAVYAGENTAIARRVAIKVLHAAVAEQQGVVERFEREAQAAGRIGNDHILEVLDLGTLADGARFMVMEFLDGETLEERVERLGPLNPQQVFPIARQILLGLAAAHSAGIIHRDLKPENIFVLKEKAGQKDYVKLIDFGISKFTAQTTDMRMTATGAVMGTPYYMAPEQARGSREADHRSDIYAVGVILYKVVTGRVPFEGATFNELLFNIVLSKAPPPQELVAGLDAAFDSIVRKAMAKDPAERFQSANEFIAALDEWAQTGAAVPLPLSNSSSGTQALPGTEGRTSTADPITGDAWNANPDGALAPAQATGASWSNSNPELPKRSNSSLWLAAAVVVGIALVAVSALVSGDDEGSEAAREAETAQSSSLGAAPSTPIEIQQREFPEETQPATEPADEPTAAPTPTSERSATKAVNTDDTEASKSTKTSTAPTPRPKPPKKVTVKPKPPPKQSPPPVRPRPKPRPKPKAPKSDDLDFGY